MDSDFSNEPPSHSVNPYAAPVADIGIIEPAATEVELIRRKYLKHEASVKSIATLYFIPAVLCLIWGISILVIGLVDSAQIEIASILVGILILSLGALSFLTALQVRKLRRWCVIPIGILSGIGLLGFPHGNAYQRLYPLAGFLCQRKVRHVRRVSASYRRDSAYQIQIFVDRARVFRGVVYFPGDWCGRIVLGCLARRVLDYRAS